MAELETLIREMVLPTSTLKPLRCEANLLSKKDRPNIAFHKSHLIFCFSRPEANHAKIKYEQFFHCFSEFLSAKSLPQELVIEFKIIYTLFRVEGFNGYSVDFKVCGYGESPDKARQIANIGYAHFRKFIAEDDIKYNFR